MSATAASNPASPSTTAPQNKPKYPAAVPEKLFSPNERVFAEDPNESWIPGTVTSMEESRHPSSQKITHKYHINVPAVNDLQIVPQADLTVVESKVHATVPDEDELGSQDDLLQLSFLHEFTLLHSIRKRYFNSIIYTKIGPIVLALNPFDYTIPHYAESEAEKYMEQGFSALSGDASQSLLPHAWTTAHQAYWLMRSFEKQQSIIVSGESGAGKTETAKIVAKYLGRVSHRESPKGTEASLVPQKVNQSSPILEAFGNAKTKRNDNSSRFGKFMKIHFSKAHGSMTGAEIEVYLLEKSRVVFHSEGERSYHAFYQTIAKDFHMAGKRMATTGQSSEHQRLRSSSMREQSPPLLAASQSSHTFAPEEDMKLAEVVKNPEVIEGVDDMLEYEGVREAMSIVGIETEDQANAWRVCAGVLHLLNVHFLKSEDGEGSVVDTKKTASALENTASLWGVPPETLERELLSSTFTISGDRVVRQHRADKAKDVRDALCKALYEKLFLELVNIVNKSVGTPDTPENWIGLLDIFGFEHFRRNSFEQLCINLANETLQGHYNSIIFKRDMEECVEEGINTESVVFQDNQPTIDLLRGKTSLLTFLDQECALGKGSDIGFCKNVAQEFKSHPNFVVSKTDPTLFGVRHYAGEVTYAVEGFREKNMDTMKDSLKQMIHDSSRPFVSKLLVVEDEQKTKARTVGAVFRKQLDGLMGVLYSTNPHWIRCVKPHPQKKPRMFCGGEVMSQLCCAGVLETVRIRKMSFSVRFTFADFWKHYRVVVDGRLTDEAKNASGRVIDHMEFPASQAQLGKTKVFLKSEAFQKIAREKEKRRIKAKNHLVAFLNGYQSVRVVAFHSHLKYVRDIQALARNRQSLLTVRDAQYDHDKKLTLLWLRSLRDCEISERACRNEILEEEKLRLAEAEDDASELLTVVYRLMFEKNMSKVTNAEEADRQEISKEFWIENSSLEQSCLTIAAEMQGRLVIRTEEESSADQIAKEKIAIARKFAAWLRSVFEAKVNAILSGEEDQRKRILFEENSAATFYFATNRLALEEKQARRVIYMRTRNEFSKVSKEAATERLVLENRFEEMLRYMAVEEEEQIRIFMMLESDREEARVKKMLLDRKKEAYLQVLEARGAAKKKFIMFRK